jgi:isoleucyl-tRNA synthetase
VHLQLIPETPAAWMNPALDAQQEAIRKVRRAVLGALEVERREKRIGASLEAAPVIHVTDAALRAALEGVDTAEVCIASAATVSDAPAPEGAFALSEVPGVAVVPTLAAGAKCARCWKHLSDVGSHPHAGVCARCDSALV